MDAAAPYPAAFCTRATTVSRAPCAPASGRTASRTPSASAPPPFLRDVLSYLGVGGFTVLAGKRQRRNRARPGVCSLFSALPDMSKMQAGQEEDANVSLFADGLDLPSNKIDAPLLANAKGPSAVFGVNEELVFINFGIGVEVGLKPGGMVLFKNGAVAILLAWKDEVGMLQLINGKVAIGDHARAMGRVMRTSASKALCGRILNPRGQPIDGMPAPPEAAAAAQRQTFSDYKGMTDRDRAYRPCGTGVLSVDFAVPIGRGQTMLFQGTDIKKDKELLWPDLMEARPTRNTGMPIVNVCVCDTLEAAEALRSKMEARGLWNQCVVVVPDSSSPGARVLAMNAAVAFAEEMNDRGAESTVILDLEPMHRLWNTLAEVANSDQGDKWVDLDGTLIQESIAARRRFWFALISRANNAVTGGSVTLLAWVWEKQGGFDHRKQQGYQKQLEQIANIPRIPDAMRQKMVDKVSAEAAALGIPLGNDAEVLPEPPMEREGVPNWEIEELKSITDGHCLLRPPSSSDVWSWNLDPYKSLPRLGTDALHPALIGVGAHKTRLKLLQGKDRAVMLHDELGSENTLGNNEPQLDLRFAELILEQPAGQPMSIQEEMVRLAVTANPKCKLLQAAPDLGTLNKLVDIVLTSETGSRLLQEGDVTEEVGRLLEEEISAKY